MCYCMDHEFEAIFDWPPASANSINISKTKEIVFRRRNPNRFPPSIPLYSRAN
jgi:hypothetical protein